MRVSRLPFLLSVAALSAFAACDDLTAPGPDPVRPTNLTYQLEPSGDPSAPAGVLLTWDPPTQTDIVAFNVYARTSTDANWTLRATTTSTTFHDAGVPESQYYVASRDANGDEVGQSDPITIDLTTRPPTPLGLTSMSLNGAVQLAWSSNAVDALHAAFDHYRVYSTAYDATRGVCTAAWVVEGTTVSDGFLASNLTNGISRCFAVSTITRDGHESVWSDARLDTPRQDARNAFVYSATARRDSSGFLFYDETARKSGVVATSTRADLDFTIERHNDGTLWFTPARSGVTMMLYSSAPVADLTSIDRAAATGFSAVNIQAVPGYGYVFRVMKSDGVHFAAVRVAFVTPDYVVFDWSYQAGVGNAELSRGVTNTLTRKGAR